MQLQGTSSRILIFGSVPLSSAGKYSLGTVPLPGVAICRQKYQFYRTAGGNAQRKCTSLYQTGEESMCRILWCVAAWETLRLKNRIWHNLTWHNSDSYEGHWMVKKGFLNSWRKGLSLCRRILYLRSWGLPWHLRLCWDGCNLPLDWHWHLCICDICALWERDFYTSVPWLTSLFHYARICGSEVQEFRNCGCQECQG